MKKRMRKTRFELRYNEKKAQERGKRKNNKSKNHEKKTDSKEYYRKLTEKGVMAEREKADENYGKPK